ncbi:MAG: glycoside hydrolase family 25 protein [Ruminococcus sp.]|jgi:GH25 family lysozyme M1 (1,4-beta-N-acetylmuramidase)|nr:glycoside hydrolase family 25 protein [Ruminococcus sp.]
MIIDVSKHNGKIDWAKAEAAGVEAVIIRAGYGRIMSQKDPCFEDNYKCAKENGIKVGAYWYSYATTPEDAEKEAKICMKVIKCKTFDYPIYFDIEERRHLSLDKQVCSDIVTAFCTALEREKYFAGVYSFDSFFETNLNEDITKRFAAWVANVSANAPKFAKNYGMWQYSWKGKVDGINGDVDLNKAYKDYPAIIAKAKLNGFY